MADVVARWWPSSVLGPKRAWKASMRKRLRAALRAIGDARVGCAYNPEYQLGRIEQAADALEVELASCSVERWGR